MPADHLQPPNGWPVVYLTRSEIDGHALGHIENVTETYVPISSLLSPDAVEAAARLQWERERVSLEASASSPQAREAATCRWEDGPESEKEEVRAEARDLLRAALEASGGKPTCNHCGGSGSEPGPGGAPIDCLECDGTGKNPAALASLEDQQVADDAQKSDGTGEKFATKSPAPPPATDSTEPPPVGSPAFVAQIQAINSASEGSGAPLQASEGMFRSIVNDLGEALELLPFEPRFKAVADRIVFSRNKLSIALKASKDHQVDEPEEGKRKATIEYIAHWDREPTPEDQEALDEVVQAAYDKPAVEQGKETEEDRRCPDDGKCHHECRPGECWRVHNASPLSGYAETWPERIVRASATRSLPPAERQRERWPWRQKAIAVLDALAVLTEQPSTREGGS